MEEIRLVAISSTLYVRVNAGVNDNGDNVWRKKGFVGVKTDATPRNIYDTALKLKTVFGSNAAGLSLTNVFNFYDDSNIPLD